MSIRPFFHDFLQDKGIRPVEYLEELEPDTKERIIFNSPYLTEICNKQYNMKWENEWRIKDVLKFKPDDIAFVIVPKEKYDEYIYWFLDNRTDNDEEFSFPVITSLTYKSYYEHLRFFPLMENGWDQVVIGRNSVCIGFKEDPDSLPELNIGEIEEFSNLYLPDLISLAKNTIQDCYEFRYTNRFFKFVDKLNDITKKSELFNKFNNIKVNANEPFHSNVDLVNNLYTELFHFLVRKNKITL